MIKVTTIFNKGIYEIIAVAEHQKDLNNLRLMSYRYLEGKDRVQLNKDKFGGPYLKFKCDEFRREDGSYDVSALEKRVSQWQEQFN